VTATDCTFAFQFQGLTHCYIIRKETWDRNSNTCCAWADSRIAQCLIRILIVDFDTIDESVQQFVEKWYVKWIDVVWVCSHLLLGFHFFSDHSPQKYVLFFAPVPFRHVQKTYRHRIDAVFVRCGAGEITASASSGSATSWVAWCPDAFMPDSQEKLRALPIDKIEVSLEEPTEAFACNLVSTGETVIMSATAPAFRAALEARGFKTITPKIDELAKGGGYIRCTTLTLDNA